MTQDYIYNDMTWAEIGDALSYVGMYEMDERRHAVKPWNKNKRLFDWWQRKDARPDRELRKALEAMKKDGKNS